MIQLISFDLDMTLLDSSTFQIPESANKAIMKLREKYKIVLATGRDMDNQYSVGYKELVRPDAIIHMNGTKITVGDELIYEHLMDKELLKKLLIFCEENGYSVGVSTDGLDYYTNEGKVKEHDIKRFGVTDRHFRDPWELMDKKVRTLAYIGGEAGVCAVESEFPQLKLPMFAGRQGADVVEKEASKAEGLKRLCAYYNIDVKDVVAFGDSMNDYEIIRLAGTGVAMGNALEEVKAAADYVTTAIDQDGIYHACQYLKLF